MPVVETRIVGYRDAHYPGEAKSKRAILERVNPSPVAPAPQIHWWCGHVGTPEGLRAMTKEELDAMNEPIDDRLLLELRAALNTGKRLSPEKCHEFQCLLDRLEAKAEMAAMVTGLGNVVHPPQASKD